MASIKAKSALVNNAAKDDLLQTNNSGVYTAADLLQNDPGSAHGIKFGAGVVDNGDGTYSLALAPGQTSFEYTVQMANGTLSTATVTLSSHLSDQEFVKNFSFEDGQTTSGGAYATVNPVPSWTSNAGSASTEIVSAGYSGIGGDGHWLDTQGSPGGISISQMLNGLHVNGHAQMSFMVAAEDITAANLSTDPNEHLTVSLGGTMLKDVTLADFTTAGSTAYNSFKQFTVDVPAVAGAMLDITSHGANGNVGFALDSVSVKQWTF